MEKTNDNAEDLIETNNPPIQYILIGVNNKIITEFSSTANSSQIKKEINQIFAKICKTQSKKYNERNKISSKDLIYYFTLIKPDSLFIVLVKEEYPEEFVFELIDKINEEKITSMINEETGELNPQGRLELKNIVDIYQKKNVEENENENENDTISDVNKNDKEIKTKNNKEISSNSTEEMEDLQIKNEVFLSTDNKRKLDFLKNYKLWIYVAIVVLVILIIVILI